MCVCVCVCVCVSYCLATIFMQIICYRMGESNSHWQTIGVHLNHKVVCVCVCVYLLAYVQE